MENDYIRGPLTTQAWVSQHFPVAHTAPVVSLQVLASQHLVLQSWYQKIANGFIQYMQKKKISQK